MILPHCVSLTLGLLVIGPFLAPSLSKEQPETKQADVDGEELTKRQCNGKLDFKTIAEFRRFVEKLGLLESSVKASHTPSGPKMLATLLARRDDDDEQSSIVKMKCLEKSQKEALHELDQLIAHYDKKRPCKTSEIAKLEQFALRHLLNNTRSITMRFFTLFGVNIALKCKLNLLAHLKQADSEVDQLDFIYSIASPTGWNILINEYAKKNMKFGSSTHQESQLINKIAKLVPGLSEVEDLDYLNFNHPLNDPKRMHDILVENDGVELGQYDLETDGGKWHTKVVESLKKVIESCRNLDQFYVNSLISLARLKELGLLVEYLGEIHERSATLHKWLAATSFCQLMVRVEVLDEPNSDNTSSIKLSIMHDDKKFHLQHRRKLYSYVAEFDEIEPEAQKQAWCASVAEGRWRQRSAAMLLPSGQDQSVAMRRLKQFIRGLERTFERDHKDLM